MSEANPDKIRGFLSRAIQAAEQPPAAQAAQRAMDDGDNRGRSLGRTALYSCIYMYSK